MTSTLPQLHSQLLQQLITRLSRDPRITGLLGGGSMVHGDFDAFSDLDIVVLVDPHHYAEVMAERHAMARSAGDLLTAFTGEHVGEPRLLICLFGPPLLHVDLKFVMLSDLAALIERPLILWARDESAVSAALDRAEIRWPSRTAQWFEDRAWTWLHYGAAKLQRGELHEALATTVFFSENILGPMLQRRHGVPQRGVRKLERTGIAEPLAALVANYSAPSIAKTLQGSAMLYLDLRGDDLPERLVPGMPELLLPWFTPGSQG